MQKVPCKNADYADDIALRETTAGIDLHVNAYKTEYMCFSQRGDIYTQNGSSLKLVDKFTYLGSSVSSTETDINTPLAKACTFIDRQSVIWKSDLTDKIKRSFSKQRLWMLTKRMKKKLGVNYTRILRAILNQSLSRHPTKQQLYGHRPPITKTIKIRRTRYAEYYWRRKDDIISDILLWKPSHWMACSNLNTVALYRYGM